MGWVDKVVVPHYCGKPVMMPSTGDVWDTGSVWVCDDCGQSWTWDGHTWVISEAS